MNEEMMIVSWLYFFNWHSLLQGSLFFRYLNELSLFLFIPFTLFYRFSPKLYIRLFLSFSVINLSYNILYLGLFKVCQFDFGYTLIDSYYIHLSKSIMLLLCIVILQTILIKIKFLNVIVIEFVLLYNMLILFLCFLLASYDFFFLYVVLEGVSFILYIFGGILSLNLISLEAIIKYFLLNSITSSIMLFSLSLVFGFVGTLNFLDIHLFIVTNLDIIIINKIYLIFFFSFFSFFFKLAVFPFNWWVADVYEGLWTPITLIFAVLIKIAIFLVFFRLCLNLYFELLPTYRIYFLTAGICSIIFGTFCAFEQVRIKRFLAYTSITQVGYIFLGIACVSFNGFYSALLHLCLYIVVSVGFFIMLINTNNLFISNNAIFFNELSNYSVFNKNLSNCVCILIMGMGSFPPIATFFSKAFIYLILFESSYDTLVILIMGCHIISAFYYLRFLQDIFFYNLERPIHKFNGFYFVYNRSVIVILYGINIILVVFILILPFITFHFSSIVYACVWPLSYF